MLYFIEITNGDVVFSDNGDLCFVDTVKWSDIFESPTQRADVDRSNSTTCKNRVSVLHFSSIFI